VHTTVLVVPEKFICTLKFPSIKPVITGPTAVIFIMGEGVVICCDVLLPDPILQYISGVVPGVVISVYLNEPDVKVPGSVNLVAYIALDILLSE